MNAFRVVPDVFSKVSNRILQIEYGSLSVNLGNHLKPSQVAVEPTKISWDADPNKLYTLVFVDPDALSKSFHIFREVLHWLVINIPGNDLSKGDKVVPYRGSGPPPWTGLHRYVFAVYEQPWSLEIDPKYRNLSLIGRFRFSVQNFANQHKLGDPYAANFFQAQYERNTT